MLLELVIFVVFVAVADYFMRLRRDRQLQNIPIVSKIPIVGSLIAMASFQPDNLHIKFDEYVKRFGKNFYARIFGTLVVVTADTRYVDALLCSQQHTHKHMIYLMLRSWLGDGLLLSHGRKWQRMRKIITPTFHFKILEQFVEVFDAQSLVLVEKLRPLAVERTVVDIYPHMGLLAMDIIAETAMGVCINAQLDSKSDFVYAVKEVTNILATRFVRPHLGFQWIFRMLTPGLYRRQKQGIAIMHDFTEKIIEKRRVALQAQTPNEVKTSVGDDVGLKQRLALLDVLLQSTIDDQPLTDAQIRDEVNTFMFEGHDTTTSATSFCLYLLSRHADCQRKLYAEIRAHFGDDELMRPIAYRDLQHLDYLNCVVKEALRIFPPIPAIGRWLKEDLPLDDVTFPANANIIVLLWAILRDPLIFPSPELFRPERHLEHNPRANAFSNIPFSAGPRNCIGQRFALYEMKTIVIQMLRHYELLPLGEDVQPSIKIVLRSKTGVNFGIKERQLD